MVAIQTERLSQAVRMIAAVKNLTPFPHWLSYSLNPLGELTATCVVRGTFSIQGDQVERHQQQDPIRLADAYYGSPLQSSLRLASDLAPYKVRGDIIFRDPIARSASYRLQETWPVQVHVGKLKYELLVMGEATHARTIFGAQTTAKRCRRVPIAYELADSARGKNPIGRDASNGRNRVPRIRSNDRSLASTTSEFAGLLPVPANWPCRLRFAGTFDDQWKTNQWPLLPSDFDYEFYNVAHPELRYDGFFQGDEHVFVSGMNAQSPIVFRLPGLPSPALLMAAARRRNRYYATLNLDTLEIDLNSMQVSLVWRGAFEPPAEPVTGSLVSALPEEVQNAS